MSLNTAPLHVYQRTVGTNPNDSLAIVARHIQAGQTVLDLGMGPGALGAALAGKLSATFDGLTHNPEEAQTAAQWYRRAVIADLETVELSDHFQARTYDRIVCADVLEHLKSPDRIVQQCKQLLKPEGMLLVSVPNASYSGLVAELMDGEFRYRPEGLLDNTHLRFFTRRSLTRFFEESGWRLQSIEITRRDLSESEFKTPFDRMPPGVARHLLARPDALTYQFVCCLIPSDKRDTTSADKPPQAPSMAIETASFTAQLYLSVESEYSETHKIVARGEIGNPSQTLLFEIPAATAPYSALRLDPADRPGFFRIQRLQLRLPDTSLVWEWEAKRDSFALTNWQTNEIVCSHPSEISTDLPLLLLGDDPWLQLPLDSHALAQISLNGGRLLLECGWPMSADYLAAAHLVQVQHLDHAQALAQLTQELAQAQAQIELARRDLKGLELAKARELQSLLQQAQAEAQKTQKQQLSLHHQELRSLQIRMQSESQQMLSTIRQLSHDRQSISMQLEAQTAHLRSIENSTVFRMTRPIVQAKMRVDRLLGKTPPPVSMPIATPPEITPIPRTTEAVDIVVPVYKGLEDTRRCLESVLLARYHLSTWRLIVINDCSPEPEVTDWLREFAKRDARIELLENPQNLGFVGTVNRGMQRSQTHDVLLLNSDTEVANDWLDRIQAAAYSRARVATVTPFSNNATICSYPRFCKPNELPDGYDTASLDALFAQELAGQAVEVPTGVGFCMYIRRESLMEVGLFDEANFGKGYGEENDYCVRANEAGWLNLHAYDTFVRHAGGISFGDSKSERELQAMVTLGRLHPRYEGNVMQFVHRDPASQARLRIDIARIVKSGKPVILNVMHNREGGTLRHVQELARHLATHATFLRLSPSAEGVELRLEGGHEGFVLRFDMPHGTDRLLQTLRNLQVTHIHFHHVLGYDASIVQLPTQLGVTYDFTAHDFYSYCPQISLTDATDRYCGEQGIAQCMQCVKKRPAPGGEDIESWRKRHQDLLSNARYVISPSLDCAQRMHRFAPEAIVRSVPHSALLRAEPEHKPVQAPVDYPANRPLRVVVIGALSKIKGADLLEQTALLASKLQAPLEFHLIGFAYRSLRTQPHAHLTVHGSYEDRDLPRLLQWLRPDVVWFPALWPETYSYTLSAALEQGLPIVAPNVGAFGERLSSREWTWVNDWELSAAQQLAFFIKIREENFVTGKPPTPYVHRLDPESTLLKLPFDYFGDYLHSLVPPNSSSLDDAWIESLASQAAGQSGSVRGASKSVALDALVRLRANPMLSGVARLIPSHWQRRIKSWLSS